MTTTSRKTGLEIQHFNDFIWASCGRKNSLCPSNPSLDSRWVPVMKIQGGDAGGYASVVRFVILNILL